MDVIEFDKQITEWAEKQFPPASQEVNAILIHLDREWKEFHNAITEWAASHFNGADPEKIEEYLAYVFQEAADIRILLTHFVGRLGGNLGQETIAKFHHNQTREWGEPDEDGVVEHIRKESENASGN